MQTSRLFPTRCMHGEQRSNSLLNASLCNLFVGWFARDPTVLHQVGHALLQLPYTEVRQPRRILVAEDCFKLSALPQEQHSGPVIRAIHKLLGRRSPPLKLLESFCRMGISKATPAVIYSVGVFSFGLKTHECDANYGVGFQVWCSASVPMREGF